MKSYGIALLLGFALDCLLGDPEGFPHPVRWIGRYISWQETRLRARGGNLRRGSVWLTATTVGLSMGIVWLLLRMISLWGQWPLIAAMAVLDWYCLSMRCLAKEANGVQKALSQSLAAARKQVGRIVGRDPQNLSEREIICATVETVAENTTDGVISPMLYAFLGGPVLAMGFKAVSTLDSMVGYLNPKYRDIGWSGAKLDDLLNWIPARICALLMIVASWLCGLDGKAAAKIVKRDHANHKSPNCAWSEAAAAGALHIRLGGAHLYFGLPVEKPTIGDEDRLPTSADIGRTVRLMWVASALWLLTLMALATLLG